ncbi:MAG: hypothetical protein KJZ83_06465 [Burkholderiaceae bacterium]|nr:hypothetical protein [Burkholderiaceae bacterium]
MIRLEYDMQFVCPAFPGNGEQDGQWRTPPLKALLRQFWRIAYAAGEGGQPNVGRMRSAEGALFGCAGKTESRRSALRLRLDSWRPGGLPPGNWPKDAYVEHPEVRSKVGANLYLGYGPLGFDRSAGGTTLKRGAAIQAGEQTSFRIALTGDAAGEERRLRRAISLIHLYAAVGSRSRNGWGSFALKPLDDVSAVDFTLKAGETRPWRDALRVEWAHALGEDSSGPLVWRTQPMEDWRGVMKRLAEIKIRLRTAFRMSTGKGAPNPEPRHWLAYPVTNHDVRAWGRSARLPNSLRFKLRFAGSNSPNVHGVIFHMPCRPPGEPFRPESATLEEVWSTVHRFLDDCPDLERIKA